MLTNSFSQKSHHQQISSLPIYFHHYAQQSKTDVLPSQQFQIENQQKQGSGKSIYGDQQSTVAKINQQSKIALSTRSSISFHQFFSVMTIKEQHKQTNIAKIRLFNRNFEINTTNLTTFQSSMRQIKQTLQLEESDALATEIVILDKINKVELQFKNYMNELVQKYVESKLLGEF